MLAVDNVVHWVVIKVRTKMGGELVEFLQWQNMLWATRHRFNWYFKYRAALLQVKYPRYEVETCWGHVPATGLTAAHLLENKKRAAKAKITKYDNKLLKFMGEWDSMYPIEDDQVYKNAVTKISQLIADFVATFNEQP